jgi:hypothetical protein
LLDHLDDDHGHDDQNNCHNGYDGGAVGFGLLFFVLHGRGRKSIHATEAFASRNSVVPHRPEFSLIHRQCDTIMAPPIAKILQILKFG